MTLVIHPPHVVADTWGWGGVGRGGGGGEGREDYTYYMYNSCLLLYDNPNLNNQSLGLKAISYAIKSCSANGSWYNLH